jgi:hypothetical protein
MSAVASAFFTGFTRFGVAGNKCGACAGELRATGPGTVDAGIRGFTAQVSFG